MEEVTDIRPVPGPGFVASLTVSTWIATSPAGRVAWLLLGHCGRRYGTETAEDVEAALLGMADAMRLAPATEGVPYIGERLLIRDSVVTLDYGHPAYSLHVPSTGPIWRDHVAGGGQACVVLGLDPLPPGAGPDAVDTYLARTTVHDRALFGAAGTRPW